MPAWTYLQKLCSFEHRYSTSENERRAGEYIREVMERFLPSVATDPFHYQDSFSWVLVLHFATLILTGVVSNTFPLAAALMALLIVVSLYGEVTSKFHLLRFIIPQGESRNIVGRLPVKNPGKRVVVTAHYDTTKAGLLFHPKVIRTIMLNSREGPLFFPYYASVAFTLVMFVKWLGGNGPVLQAVYVLLNLFLGLLIALLIEREVAGKKVMGASDNAAGVGVMLALAERLARDAPANTEVWFAATGCQEALQGGMLDFVRRHIHLFNPASTFFLNIDFVGSGNLSYSLAEGPAFRTPTSPELQYVSRSVADREPFRGIGPRLLRSPTDALVPLVRGFQALTYFAADESGVIPNYHNASDEMENVDRNVMQQAEEYILEVIRFIDKNL